MEKVFLAPQEEKTVRQTQQNDLEILIWHCPFHKKGGVYIQDFGTSLHVKLVEDSSSVLFLDDCAINLGNPTLSWLPVETPQ